jgi:peptidoglycan-N-acetylglucosamine deacetylase
MKQIAATIWIVMVVLVGCTGRESGARETPSQGGVCISFDDRSVHEWFAIRPLLQKYNARVTFFVTQWDSLSAEEKNMLRILQEDGHEIGFHGALHVVSEYYIKEHSMAKYIEDEIEAGIEAMHADGFYPTSFAYPYSAKYWFTDRALLKHFSVLRSEAIPKEGQQPAVVDDAFSDLIGDRLIYALSLENKGLWTGTAMRDALNRVADNKEVLALYGHVPGAKVDITLLEEVLEAADKKKLQFLRVSDLVNVKAKT